MDKIKTLIISNSYILASGLQSVLNEITEIQYLNIEFKKDTIFQDISEYNPDVIIFNEDYLAELTAFVIDNNYVYIGIGNTQNKAEYFIDIFNDDKSTIISLIRRVISEKFNQKPRIKSDELSSREITIVKLIAQGLTNQEIADELFLSKHTVITHRKNITNKLNIKTVSGLTVYAILNNIIDIKEVK